MLMDSSAVAGGSEAHVHHFRRDPELLDHIFMQHSELDLPQGDIFCMSSFDGICTLGTSIAPPSRRKFYFG
jgi:WD repeat-containing protein 21A